MTTCSSESAAAVDKNFAPNSVVNALTGRGGEAQIAQRGGAGELARWIGKFGRALCASTAMSGVEMGIVVRR